jgi:hypothetical protein
MKGWFVLCTSVVWAFPAFATDRPEKKPVPTYTNEDLARVAPYRHQTGALSEPASSFSEDASGSRNATAATRAKQERYWRREAQKLRNRLRPAREQVEDLRFRIGERGRLPGVRPFTDPTIQAWERKLESLTRKIRDWELRFEERARRERALPGWLR